MPAKGVAAQAEKARRRAEKRAARVSAHGPDEEQDFRKALGQVFHDLGIDIQDITREVISARMSKIKAENMTLREAAEKAQKTAESRRLELDGQVERARRAEKRLQDEAAGVRAAKDAAAEGIEAARDAAKGEIKRLTEIVEEQSSTIRAQARALREAEKAAKVV